MDSETRTHVPLLQHALVPKTSEVDQLLHIHILLYKYLSVTYFYTKLDLQPNETWWIRKELNLFLRIFSPPHKPLLPLIHKRRFYGNPTTVLAVALFFSHNRLWRPTSIYYSVSILHNIYRDMRPPTHGRLVRMKGLEPPRIFQHQILSLAWLPLHHIRIKKLPMLLFTTQQH